MGFYFHFANLPEKCLGKIKIQEVTLPRKKEKSGKTLKRLNPTEF